MNVEIGAEAALFPKKEYINGIAVAVWTVHNSTRPRNITLRKGMFSSLWSDVSKMVAARNMDIMDNNGTSVPAADFLRCSRTQRWSRRRLLFAGR
jgi:hypothetical protein